MENEYRTVPVYPEQVSLGNWIITLIITFIPIVNIIMLFVWGFSRRTIPAKANWAKAALILMAVWIILGLIFGGYVSSWFFRGGYPAAY